MTDLAFEAPETGRLSAELNGLGVPYYSKDFLDQSGDDLFKDVAQLMAESGSIDPNLVEGATGRIISEDEPAYRNMKHYKDGWVHAGESYQQLLEISLPDGTTKKVVRKQMDSTVGGTATTRAIKEGIVLRKASQLGIAPQVYAVLRADVVREWIDDDNSKPTDEVERNQQIRELETQVTEKLKMKERYNQIERHVMWHEGKPVIFDFGLTDWTPIK